MAVAPSQDAATRKRAAIDIDDETDGPQTKKQRFTFKHEIPSKEQTTCCIKNCSQKAISSWESNLKPGFYRNLCEECLVDEFSGLPNGVDSIKTSADSNGGHNTQVEQVVVSSAPLRAAASKKKATLKKKAAPKKEDRTEEETSAVRSPISGCCCYKTLDQNTENIVEKSILTRIKRVIQETNIDYFHNHLF